MGCRVCQGQEMETRLVVRSWTLLRCVQCGFQQIAERPTEVQLREIYSRGYFEKEKYRDQATLSREFDRRLALLRKHCVMNKPVILEFGCASGEFIQHAGAALDCWGFDVSPDAIAIAKEAMPEHADRFASGSFNERLYPQNSFDAIVLWDVIEHVWDPIEVLSNVLPLLKPGGIVVLSTPDASSVPARLFGRYWAFMTPPEHLGFFTHAAMRVLADHLRLRIIDSRSMGKWVNVGFLLYKLKRIAPALVPSFVRGLFQQGRLSRWAVYVPTRDVQYVVFEKGL
jgi:2-polyprenyl-3-methyl-5-hydroxy-6-metoxy-1,4-benzoquinol methylase